MIPRFLFVWLAFVVLSGCGAAEHEIQKMPPEEEAKKLEEMRQRYRKQGEEMQKQRQQGGRPGGPGGPPGT